MKQFIKAIAPKPALNIVRELRDWPRLHMLSKQNFNLENLRLSSELSLEGILGNTQGASAWNKDHKAIIALFGDENKMGGVNPGDRRALYYLIAALRPKNVLEIGTHIGASTLYIAHALKKNDAQGKVSSVDIIDVNDPEKGPWKQAGLPDSPKTMALRLGCSAHAEFSTSPCLDFMRATKERYDLVFLDGDHTAQAVYQEVSAALSILNKGGIILLHDYYPDARPLFPDGNVISGPFRALARIKKENGEIDVLPLGTLPWLTKQGTNITSLAVIVRKT